MATDFGPDPAFAASQSSRVSPSRPSGLQSGVKELVNLLAPLVSGGADSCLKGTPMIPLHCDTVAAILAHLDAIADPPSSAICGYPIPGWRLDVVQHDTRQGQPDGWIVSLKREGLSNRRNYIAMARSDLGPLEAWEEAIQIAQRDDQRAASADTRPKGGDSTEIEEKRDAEKR